MSRTINKVILIGHVGSKPTTRSTANGTTVTNFSIATNEKWKDKEGTRQQRTEWHKIVAWSKLAEICSQYLDKGRLIYIEGRLETKEWTDKNQNKRFTTQIIADQINFLDKAPTQGQQHNDYDAPVDEDVVDGTNSYVPEDDIPF